MSLVIGTYWWSPDAGSKFGIPYRADDVRLLQRMVARHCTVPHEFVVLTDQPDLFHDDKDIRAFHLSLAHQKTHVPKTCFVRLFTFSPYAKQALGDRFLQLDLDTVITGNIDHLVTREEPLVLWKNPTRLPWEDLDEEGKKAFVAKTFPALASDFASIDWRKRNIYCRDDEGQTTYVVNQLRTYYNTSVVFHHCGAMPEIWERFDPRRLPAKDDQWYLSDLFGMDCPYFDGEHDGVYRIGRDDTPNSGVFGELPANACIVTCPGDKGKPWMMADGMQRFPWIAEHRV
jgi:hypothetical protein